MRDGNRYEKKVKQVLDFIPSIAYNTIAMAKRHAKLSDQVRRAVAESGMSRYAICKAIGMDQSIMSRFMTGKGGLSMANLDAVADLLRLDIKARRKYGRKAR